MIRILRWQEDQPVANDVFWNDHAEALLDRTPDREGVPELIERLKSFGSLLPYFPLMARGFPPFFADDLDNIWVPDFSASSLLSPFDARYRVFSLHGEWLGWVNMPERSRVLAVQDSRALVLRFDQYRRPAVAVYRLDG